MILSDIHIGNDSPTNWYQSELHAPFLEKALAWGGDAVNKVDQLVILGDLVDQWTYAPDIIPPSFSDITTALCNNSIFGNGMALAVAISKISERGGEAVYVNGNHDMNVATSDIMALSGQMGAQLKHSPFLYYEPDMGNKPIYLSHGHLYSLFCAPDYANPPSTWNHIPLGHFITRMSALWDSIILQNNPSCSNVAELPDTGNPMGASMVLGAIVAIYEQWKSDSELISRLIMDALVSAVEAIGGKAPSSFKLPGMDPSGYPSVEDVVSQYGNLAKGPLSAPTTTYPSVPNIDAKYYGDLLDRKHLMLALAIGDTDAMQNLMGWVVPLETTLNWPVITMGHTHKPKNTVHNIFNIAYTNSGFNCPSAPDMKLQPPCCETEKSAIKVPTFSVLEWNSASEVYALTVYEVVRHGSIGSYTYTVKVLLGPKPIEASRRQRKPG